jgi:RNA polymerase sigma-70 factor (sigma-E family)
LGAARPSFDEFAVAELPRLLGRARALTADEHDAWDLVQDCLVRIHRNWSRIDADGNPAGYAHTVLVRLNIDRLRRLRRELPSRSIPETAIEPTHRPEPEAWLVEAMRALTPRQRTAIVLRYVDDLDIAGVARAMDCSVGTAKSHLSRAREELRRHAPAGPAPAETAEGDQHG